MPFWHPKGMVIWRKLEEIRQRENAKRGYLEVKTPLIYDAETFFISGTPEVRGPDVQARRRRPAVGDEGDELPGHMLLFGKLRSYRELPLRYAEPRRCTGTS